MLVYHINRNLLVWGEKTYEAVSGPHGNGSLPEGYYDVFTDKVVDDPNMGAAYCLGGICFFIPIQPKFETHRYGFGIHPDGNVPGTLGCIGLTGMNSVSSFWTDWNFTPFRNRPTLLYVESRTLDLEKIQTRETRLKQYGEIKPIQIEKLRGF